MARVRAPVVGHRTVEPIVDAALDRALAPYRDPIVMMPVKCGTCHRTLGIAHPCGQHPTVEFHRSTNTAPNYGVARQWVTVELVDGRDLVEGSSIRITCHPKCNRGRPRKWVVSNKDFVGSFARAAAAGRRELVFGDNL
jgi:hypothetical protein